ncbi:MAG TPA: NAD(P)-dependent oxidoreductase [Terriglobales bacterium]|nr:NAD(P)-dependent oxidoreductase [Terriglobales bacterium]
MVTGAQGFIGRHMVCHLLCRFPEYTVLGVGRSPQEDLFFNYPVSCGGRRLPASLPEYLRITVEPRYRYVSLDLTSDDFIAMVRDFRPTKVIHLAAALRGAPDEVIFQNNVRSTASLLHAILPCDVEMLLFASSGGVYGKQDHFPIEETAAVQPLDSYSRSKLASEELVRQFAIQSGVSSAIARIFNVFGPGQDDLHFAGRIAGQLASILAHKAEPLVRVGPLSSSRDFLDVRDICHGLTIILESNHQGVYNVGSGVETSMDAVLRIFLDAAGLRKDVRIEIDATRIDPVPRHVANISRLTKKGFVPQHSLELSCEEMLAYFDRYVQTA